MLISRQSARWTQRLVGFIFVIVLANPVAQTLGIKYWMPYANNRTLKIYFYQRDNICPDVLFLGSSKIIRAIIPSVIEPELSRALGRPVTVFCLGQAGTSAFASSLVLRDVLASNGTPPVVVVEASPGTLNENHENIPDALRYYCSFRDLLRAVPQLQSSDLVTAAAAGAFRGMSNLALYGWCSLFPRELPHLLKEISRSKGCTFRKPFPVTPWRLSDYSPAGKRKQLDRIRSNVRQSFLRQFRIGGAPEKGFQAICRLTRERGIKLIVISPPVTRAYKQEVFRAEEYRQFTEYMTELSEKGSMEFHDLNDAPLRLGLRDYFDFGHVNSEGAGKVSRYLARRVLAPAMKKTGRDESTASLS